MAGAGTAGHVEPALALADLLVGAEPPWRVVLLGTAAGLETRLVPARGHQLATIPRVPFPRRPTAALMTAPFRLAAAVRAAGVLLDREGASVVVGFGGYVAGAAYLAARQRGLPIVVHEANARAGLANRLGARMTSYVALAYAECGLRAGQLTGTPLRPAIANLDRAAARAAARRTLGFDESAPLLLVSGGSQGARRLNDAAVGAAEELATAGVSVLHISGPAHAAEVAALVAPYPSHQVLAYLDDIDQAYAAADLMLCRAGAMTCAELAAVGLPAVYVPLPIGNGEQRLNAMPVVSMGGGLLVNDAELTGRWVTAQLLPLLLSPDRLAQMSRAARASSPPDPGHALLTMVEHASARMDG